VGNLVTGLARDPYRHEIWCLEEEDRFGRELRQRGVSVVELGRRRRRDLDLFRRLATRLRRDRVDILHCHDVLSWFYGTIAALGGRARVVVTMHGRRPSISKRHLIEQRLLTFGTAAIVSVSEYLKRQLVDELRLASGRVLTILNGIPIDRSIADPGSAERRIRARRALGLSEDAIVVGSVGELSSVKHLDLAIEALGEARRRVPSLQLVLIGDGAERDRLTRLATDLGLEGAVCFAGIRRDVGLMLQAFDLYVCSSHYEGISLAILEAMAAGLPIVATAVGGNTEILADRSGVLVPSDDKARLAATFVELAVSPESRLALGNEARRRVCARHSLEGMLAAYDSLYHQVLRRSATRDIAGRETGASRTPLSTELRGIERERERNSGALP
jgi:glycosyltransferase involved in cell wall biosynthesis